MGLPVRRAVLSKDVGQFQGWLLQGLRPWFAWLGVAVDVIERTHGSGHHLRADAGVAGGGVDLAMAEEDLNDADVGAVFE